MKPGPELNQIVAAEVAGWIVVKNYSTDIGAAMDLANVLIDRLDPAAGGLYTYPVLLRTGHFGECWAVSFDFNLDPEWHEHVENYPMAARGENPAHALSLAMLKVSAIVKADYEAHKVRTRRSMRATRRWSGCGGRGRT